MDRQPPCFECVNARLPASSLDRRRPASYIGTPMLILNRRRHSTSTEQPEADASWNRGSRDLFRKSPRTALSMGPEKAMGFLVTKPAF